MHKVKIEAFEGPLALLLKLIEDEELDITQISLARVTDQYLEHLNLLSDRNPEELADFLVIATKLLLIKSQILLPTLSIEDENESRDLSEQLKIYKEFLEASRRIQKIISQKKFLFFRPRVLSDKPIFAPPQKIEIETFKNVFLKVLGQIEPIVKLPEEEIRRVITLEEKIAQIQNLIFNKLSVNFKEVIAAVRSKNEIIVSFLALLELAKQRQIRIYQKNIFKEIVIRKI